ncbi:spermatogenesis-associated protein 45-like [Anoplopoma fimbria]|uniref:spermatogenesis-associated protein 45-like n=1 Tax=Anoplopoma fimbria TaxID=229290 RepID=UPI0023EC72B8|nr:spermatogenesis-associated protein 45-like [Anoplopoma fimbria]
MSGAEQRALLELNLRRETWCQVEVNPQQSWELTQRRHYQSHLQTSPVLLTAMTAGQQPRSARRELQPPSQLLERRHFRESSKKPGGVTDIMGRSSVQTCYIP